MVGVGVMEAELVTLVQHDARWYSCIALASMYAVPCSRLVCTLIPAASLASSAHIKLELILLFIY